MEQLIAIHDKLFIWFVIQPRDELIEKRVKKERKMQEEHLNALKDSYDYGLFETFV